MISLICVWINGWVNNSEAGDLRCHRGHYDVNVIWTGLDHLLTHLPLVPHICVRESGQYVFIQILMRISSTKWRPFCARWMNKLRVACFSAIFGSWAHKILSEMGPWSTGTSNKFRNMEFQPLNRKSQDLISRRWSHDGTLETTSLSRIDETLWNIDNMVSLIKTGKI